MLNTIIKAVKKDVLYYESAMKQLNTYLDIMNSEFKSLSISLNAFVSISTFDFICSFT